MRILKYINISIWILVGLLSGIYSYLYISSKESQESESNPKIFVERVSEIVDADTIVTESGITIRLYGIDALERDQLCVFHARPWKCGEVAVKELERIIGEDKIVKCKTFIKLNRVVVARCLNARDQDISYEMLKRGFAVVDKKIHNNTKTFFIYKLAEEYAQVNRRGMFKGSYYSPEFWRKNRYKIIDYMYRDF